MDPISAFVGLADEVLSLVNTEVMRQNVQDLKNAKLQLEAELAKGYGRDDRMIEDLQAKIPILQEAVINEIKVYNSRGPSSSVASTVTSTVAAATK